MLVSDPPLLFGACALCNGALDRPYRRAGTAGHAPLASISPTNSTAYISVHLYHKKETKQEAKQENTRDADALARIELTHACVEMDTHTGF